MEKPVCAMRNALGFAVFALAAIYVVPELRFGPNLRDIRDNLCTNEYCNQSVNLIGRVIATDTATHSAHFDGEKYWLADAGHNSPIIAALDNRRSTLPTLGETLRVKGTYRCIPSSSPHHDPIKYIEEQSRSKRR